ncbi:TIGR04283 family arsenosugar biosynthesis glycosyltransferase [Hydrogenophaga sp.]|uniref:TIGR04283 family arsenosugar biosynthesis glycosyltransferase n=1 Tax=Hydrogenophaga sp. TaxID=1904254 RepID=UPI0025C11077|nr:TIGR04283 family arsenosugar biosynthesis glycosyltransferase [Hydrogenophaga sp.]
MKLAMVMPVLNEAATLPARLATLTGLRSEGVSVIAVDGGSDDETVVVARSCVDAVVHAPRGRAAQMNAGACHPLARRADALLFLHADTALPVRAVELVSQALASDAIWGRFDVRIEGRHPLLPMVAAFMNRRSRWSGIATGDQAMFVRRAVFESLGGFAPLPLMEDIELSTRLKGISPPVCLREQVTTAGRRWDQRGFWRTVWLMWRLRAAWTMGGDAHALARRYGYAVRAPAAVAVLAKAPVPGQAKTRLAPLLGHGGAARAQRGFILRTLATARRASTGPLTLHGAQGAVHRLFHLLRDRWGVACVPQADGDIGERMAAVMVEHFERSPRLPLLIVGTDCPVLTPEHLQKAADALQTHDAVLIPAEDGGYVLIGLRVALPGVFQKVAWSTPRVMAQTRQRLIQAGARWQELPALWDVDDPQDWIRWQALASATPDDLHGP